MEIKVTIPHDLVSSLFEPGEDPGYESLQAIGLEALRQNRISEYQLRNLLGLESRWDLHAVLKKHKVEFYTAEDFEKDWATILEFERRRKTEPAA